MNKAPLAVFTMVHNEHQMLRIWSSYYLKQVGEGNVYIIDHGSDHIKPLKGCKIISIEHSGIDEIDRAKQIADFQKNLLEKYQFVLFTDCDEFLVARPSNYLSLVDYVRNQKNPTIQCVGIDVIEHEADLPPVDWNQPILAQRPYGALRFWSCKALLSSVPVTWQPGFHTCDAPVTLDTNLWMFHLKYADQKHLLNRLKLTRSLKWSDRARAMQHGASHRVPDAAMIRFIQNFQKLRHETSLETLDLSKLVETGAESPMHAIPEIFLKAF
ncbi:glycosyltransferase family 2 protein [Gluconobacter kondonii]|uniref:glycosyltransferase family 2 protein n=1 Tax=Gluconobacter kondonii TaxID=941463 RepID=UPI001980D3D9|nr:glycosyltransferase family 2 protein [Gluconobacter kondonii]